MKTIQKVFVTGNSLTAGFGTHGMASSRVDTDWFYHLTEGLKEKNPDVQVERTLFNAGWERAEDSAARKEAFEKNIAPYIDDKTDIVLIQLGDNVNIPEQRERYRKDAADLVRYCRAAAPNARVIWLYGWYEIGDSMQVMQEAMADVDCELADLRAPASAPECHSFVGAHYVNGNGENAVIDHAGVASHPGDLGMKKIAEIVLRQIFSKE